MDEEHNSVGAEGATKRQAGTPRGPLHSNVMSSDLPGLRQQPETRRPTLRQAILARGQETFRVIAERDLLIYIRSRALQRLTIVETGTGAFRLHIRLSVERDELLLSHRPGRPREWSSLNRLADHIRSRYGTGVPVLLSLCSESATAARP